MYTILNMSFFSRTNRQHLRYGAVIEIGSGSVITAIVASNNTATHPDIIWSKREFALIGTHHTPDQAVKEMLTTLMNAMMNLDSEGRATLYQTNPTAHIDTVQVSVAAPWAYTISKIVRYEHDEPFVISENLIESLTHTANERTLAVITESREEGHGAIAVMTRATTDITANDYRTMRPIGKTARTLSLTQVSAVGQQLIVAAISDLKDKLFADATLERYSSMLIFHSIIRELYGSITEFCLVEMTYEATELAIIRDGVLHYSTHTPIGINTLIRNIAITLDIPDPEARTLMRHVSESGLTDLTAREQEAITAIFAEYQSALESLFHETGDSLAIPKILFLHGNMQFEQLFDDYMIAAARAATSSSHTVHCLSAEILASQYGTDRSTIAAAGHDTAILMAAQFFHKHHHRASFIQV